MLIAAILPAYNEEKTIGRIIELLKKVEIIDQIIVVSDGSSDRTVEIASSLGVKVIALKQNIGKGGAMRYGVDFANAGLILFLDADLIGLRVEHIFALLLPVLEDRADMTVGIFGQGRLTTDFAHRIAPFLSGQRVVRKNILEEISNLDLTRFGFEMALTKYMMKSNFRVEKVLLPDLTHVMKEEKMGFIRGFAARLKMYWEIAKYAGRG